MADITTDIDITTEIPQRRMYDDNKITIKTKTRIKTTIYTYNNSSITKEELYNRVATIYTGDFKTNIIPSSKMNRPADAYYLYFTDRLDKPTFNLIAQLIQSIMPNKKYVYLKYYSTNSKGAPYDDKYGEYVKPKETVAFIDDCDE